MVCVCNVYTFTNKPCQICKKLRFCEVYFSANDGGLQEERELCTESLYALLRQAERTFQ